MFIGHLPAGYVLTRAVWSKLERLGIPTPGWRPFLLAGLVASVFPDIDLLYFYLVDNRQHLHHSYWTHLPFYWLVIGILGLSFISVSKKKRLIPYLLVVEANLFLHCFLDTIVGKIRWLYPLSKHDIVLFDIPMIYDWWIFNFVLHWTFLLEILAWLVAIYVYMQWPVNNEGAGHLAAGLSPEASGLAPQAGSVRSQ